MDERLWRYCNQIQARYDTPVLTILINLKRGRPGVRLETRESDLGPDLPGSGTSPSASPAARPPSTWLAPSPWPGPSRL
jgi:hypothetical protein